MKSPSQVVLNWLLFINLFSFPSIPTLCDSFGRSPVILSLPVSLLPYRYEFQVRLLLMKIPSSFSSLVSVMALLHTLMVMVFSCNFYVLCSFVAMTKSLVFSPEHSILLSWIHPVALSACFCNFSSKLFGSASVTFSVSSSA